MNYGRGGWGGAPLTKGVQIYSFASFLNFVVGDKAGLGLVGGRGEAMLLKPNE